MMSSKEWAGFTDKDIQQIKKKSTKITAQYEHQDNHKDLQKYKNANDILRKCIQESESAANLSIKLCKNFKSNDALMMQDDIAQNLSTQKHVISVLEPTHNQNCLQNNQMKMNSDICCYELSTCQSKNRPTSKSTNDLYNSQIENESKSYCSKSTEELECSNMSPLEVFEKKEKQIKTENARRRALISKAIMDKKKRTQAEIVKLGKITEELNHLDNVLSNDIAILRNSIEKASMEFHEAEKRYLKAEKEFVDAKLSLFERMQQKEMLTEHLCAIIEHNENRKADKLIELMKQLEMEAVAEDCQENGLQSIISNLCTLNDEAYFNCQTIKPSFSKSLSTSSDKISKENESHDFSLPETSQI